MYFLPRPMVCPKCGHEGEHSIHSTPGLVLRDQSIICPDCFEKWVKENCGVLENNNVRTA